MLPSWRSDVWKEERAPLTKLTFERLDSPDVCPLPTDALSTSFRLLPFGAFALPLRGLREPCSFSLIACVSSVCCFLGGMAVGQASHGKKAASILFRGR
jgi:hypothetical protein